MVNKYLKAKPESNGKKKKYSTFSSLSTIKLVLVLAVLKFGRGVLLKVRSVSVYSLMILMKLVSTSGTKKSAVGHDAS
jgi:hypothetical protein